MKPEPLTPRQREVFDFIAGFFREHRMSPTFRDIGDAFGIQGPNGPICHLTALEKKGYIRLTDNKARAIQIVGVTCSCCGGLGVVRANAQAISRR